MSNDPLVMHSQHCLYENDEIMVDHSVMDFPYGNREAIMSFNALKDRQIVRRKPEPRPSASSFAERKRFPDSMWFRSPMCGNWNRIVASVWLQRLLNKRSNRMNRMTISTYSDAAQSTALS
jgi:hypothetical protein